MTSVSLSAASAAEGPPATRRPLSARASRLHVRMLFLLRGVSSTSVEPVPHSSQRVTPVSSRYPECCVAPALRRPAPPCYAPPSGGELLRRRGLLMPAVNLEVRDPRLAAVVGPDVTFERIASSCLFTEGPLWHPRDR